jgi:TRAP-type C4-dicarboxylate transport system substrate-binding protein
MKKTLSWAASAIFLLSAATATAAEKWDFPVGYPLTNFQTQNNIRFAKAVEEATNGKLQITVHVAGSLFKGPEIKRAVQNGLAQLGARPLLAEANQSPLFEISELPFIATSYDQAKKLLAASKKDLVEVLDKQNLVYLYSVAWPPQGLLSTFPINSVEDMKGKKFRADGIATAHLAEKLGAAPVYIDGADLGQAYATGMAQLHITSGATPLNMKLYEYAKYYYAINAWLPLSTVFINKEVWNGLDDHTKGVLREAAAKAEEAGWQLSESEAERYDQELQSKGVKVGPPTEKLAAQLRTIGNELVQEWVEKAGPQGKAILDSYKKM